MVTTPTNTLPNLVAEEQDRRFQALTASVDVVPEEQVVPGRREAHLREDAHQVRKLSVDVAADDNRRRNFNHRRLGLEHADGGPAQGFDLVSIDLQKDQHKSAKNE